VPGRRLIRSAYRYIDERPPREPPRELLPLREPRERDPPRPRELDLLELLRREFDERLLRGMIVTPVKVVYLHAGTASSSNELPNEGNESDHEEQVDQPTRHVEDDKAKQPCNDQNDRESGKHVWPPVKWTNPPGV
jgi:hypothetical protein